MADAFFQISRDGGTTWDSGDQGFDAQASDVLSFRLKNRPSTAQQVRFQVWDPAGFDPKKDVFVNPPRQSPGAPTLTLVGASSGSSVSPAGSVDGNVQTTLSATRFVAYLIRCVVDNGITSLPDGRDVIDPTKIHQRMVVVRDANDLRPIVASETTEYEDDGWAAAFNALITGPTGPTGDTGPTGPTGTGAATGTDPGYISRRVFVNAASARVGTTFAGVTVEAATAIADAAALGAGNLFHCVEVGCGGASTGGNATSEGMGYPGAGGCWNEQWLSREAVLALLPVTPVCPLAPAGGVHLDTSSDTAQPTRAAPTEFGPHKAYAGGCGAPGGSIGRTAATGGGSLGSGVNGTTSTNATVAGGLPGSTAARGVGTAGAGALAAGSGSSLISLCSEDGGASAASATLNNSLGGQGGRSKRGGGGGGVGGGHAIPGPAGAGGDGGKSGAATDAERGGGGLGGTGATVAHESGGDGADGADGDETHAGDGGGGGGIGWGITGDTHGGKGGKGGFPGGGAGGGGSNNSFAGAGDGNDAGDSMVMITAYP